LRRPGSPATLGGVRAAAQARPGLRERKKQRTREAIVRAATRLFAERGYQATTVAEVAEAAEVSPSTVFAYFPAKPDLVFALLDAVIESAQRRVVGRPAGERADDAVVAWIRDDLPVVEAPYKELMRALPSITADPELQAAERLRMARFEDVLATAFARDLGEGAGGMRAHVLATIALRGMAEVWDDWYAHHRGDLNLDLADLAARKSAYVREALAAGRAAIELLPSPVS